VAEKLGIRRIVVPRDAGVGSAIGFLLAPVAYEVVRSRHVLLSAFPRDDVESVYADMRTEAEAVVRPAAEPGAVLDASRRAYMRYVGQGHEIAVPVPEGAIGAATAAALRDAFERTYAALYGRLIPGLDVEVLSWTLTLAARDPAAHGVRQHARDVQVQTLRSSRERTASGAGRRTWSRDALRADESIEGPALVTEAQTTTVVAPGFHARVDSSGHLVLERTRERRSA
jgi:N-methylhydantoinase A